MQQAASQSPHAGARYVESGSPKGGESSSFSPDEARQYHDSGFVAARGLYSTEEIVRMGDAVEGILAELREAARKGDPTARKDLTEGTYVGLTLRRPYLRDYFRKPGVVERLAALIGPEIGFLSDKIVFKSEDVSFPTPWHQDHEYWGGSNKISVWIALDDATVDNGCMQFLPGSHLTQVAHDHPENPEDGFSHKLVLEDIGLNEEDKVTIEAAPGDAVFFHDQTLHRSTPNRSGDRRRAFIITYRDLGMPDEDYEWAVAAEAIG